MLLLSVKYSRVAPDAWPDIPAFFIFAGLNRITIMTSRILDRMNGHKKRPDGHHTNVLQQLHSSSLEKI